MATKIIEKEIRELKMPEIPDFRPTTWGTVAGMSKTAGQIYEHNKANRLISNTDIQRNLVWTDIDKTKLILSILRKIPIGSLLWNELDGGLKYEIIDGKQRIDAITECLDDKLKFKIPISEKKEFVYLQNKKLSELPPSYKAAIISSLPVDIIVMSGDKEHREELDSALRAAFGALDEGVKHSPGDKLRVIPGKVKDAAVDIAESSLYFGNAGTPDARHERIAILSQLLRFESFGTKQMENYNAPFGRAMQEFFKINADNPEVEQWKKGVNCVLDKINALVTPDTLSYIKSSQHTQVVYLLVRELMKEGKTPTHLEEFIQYFFNTASSEARRGILKDNWPAQQFKEYNNVIKKAVVGQRYKVVRETYDVFEKKIEKKNTRELRNIPTN